MTGRLCGVGVGPGDPELITLKAARIIEAADIIAYPVLEKGQSLARDIARNHIKSQRELRIEIPMTHDRLPAQKAYDQSAQEIEAALNEDASVVVLCEGDALFYGSFMYLFARLSKRFPVEVIPGVSSVMACAAVACRPLVARNEVFTVLPAPLSAADITQHMKGSETLAIMKVGRHLKKIKEVIHQEGLLSKAIYVERATMAEERVLPLEDAPEDAPYFSMVLITKGADPWL